MSGAPYCPCGSDQLSDGRGRHRPSSFTATWLRPSHLITPRHSSSPFRANSMSFRPWVLSQSGPGSQPRTRIRASEVPSHLVRERGKGVGLLPIFSSIAPSVTSHRYSKAVGLIFCKPRAARVTLIMGREISGTLSRSPFVKPPTTFHPPSAPYGWNDTFKRLAKLSPH